MRYNLWICVWGETQAQKQREYGAYTLVHRNAHVHGYIQKSCTIAVSLQGMMMTLVMVMISTASLLARRQCDTDDQGNTCTTTADMYEYVSINAYVRSRVNFF